MKTILHLDKSDIKSLLMQQIVANFNCQVHKLEITCDVELNDRTGDETHIISATVEITNATKT